MSGKEQEPRWWQYGRQSYRGRLIFDLRCYPIMAALHWVLWVAFLAMGAEMRRRMGPNFDPGLTRMFVVTSAFIYWSAMFTSALLLIATVCDFIGWRKEDQSAARTDQLLTGL